MKKPRTGGAGLLGVPWGGTSDGEGAPSHYLVTPLAGFPCQAFCLTANPALLHSASSLRGGNLGRLETRRNMPWEKPEPVELPAFRTDGSKEGCQPHVQCKSRDTAQIGAAGDNHKSSLLIATISLAYRIGKTQRRDVRSAQPTHSARFLMGCMGCPPCPRPEQHLGRIR